MNTKAQLNAMGVFNPHGLAKHCGGLTVYVEYSPQDLGRIAHFAKWQVIRIGYKTDPDGHWSDNGHKTFTAYNPREEKEKQLQAALAWASERYGITEWERSPFGSYHPKGTGAAIAKAKGGA